VSSAPFFGQLALKGIFQYGLPVGFQLFSGFFQAFDAIVEFGKKGPRFWRRFVVVRGGGGTFTGICFIEAWFNLSLVVPVTKMSIINLI